MKEKLDILTNSLSHYFEIVKKHPPLSRDKERELFKRLKSGESQLIDLLANHNLALVISVAKRYVNKGLDFDDLIQEGNLGLLKAIDKFDLDRECKFSTYAIWWVRQGILRKLTRHNKSKFVFIEDLKEILLDYKKYDSDLGGDYFECCLTNLNNDFKREFSFTEDSFFENMDYEKFQQEIRDAMSQILNEKEYFIITKRYLGSEKVSLGNIGNLLPQKVCCERVRQLERKAFKKMRDNPIMSQLINNYL